MKILIGTKNPGKIVGAKEAFLEFFREVDIEGIQVSSDVSDEPVDDDIYNGANNRVNNLIKYAKENNIDAKYFLGVESGITKKLGKWVIINIAVIKDKNGVEAWGTSAGFPVPDKYAQKIIDTNLNQVMDDIFGKSEQRAKGKGGIGLLTHDLISRIDLTKQAFIMALTMFINQDKWNSK